MNTKHPQRHYKSTVNVHTTPLPLVAFLAIATFLIGSLPSCKTPTEITARPDPTAATSGTLGSSKATDGIIPLQPTKVPDTTQKQ